MATAVLTKLSARRTELAPTVAVAYATLATALVAADHGGYWPTSWGWTTLTLTVTALVALVLGAERPGSLELAWLGGLVLVCAWTAASIAWTTSKTATTLEVERSLVYAALAVGTIAVARRASVAALFWGTWAGTTLTCLYALATRLFPDRLGVSDTVAGYRLATPVGYWNGLGLVAATAALLAVGLVIEGTRIGPRIVAGASLPLLAPTLYFTFSRGAWIALAAGIALVVLISPRRLRFVTALGVLAVPSAAAVALAYHQRPLRLSNVPLVRAVGSGHTLAWQLLLTIAVGGFAAALWATLADRIEMPRPVRIGYAAALAAALVAAVGIVVVHYGGPTEALSHARRSLEGTSSTGPDVSKRLLTLGSPARIDQWHVSVDEWRGHRLLGTGAGTYAQYWMAARSNAGKVLDVHNLYLETLAELGIIGLLVLAATLAVPLAGALKARRMPLIAVAAGAYGVWLAHAAYDWDWELPAATLPAFICAGAILAAGRIGGARPATGRRQSLLVAAALAVGVVGTLGLVENRALVQSADHAQRGDYKGALELARRARWVVPWSSDPWVQIAGIRIAQGRRADAVDAYRHAVAKDPNDWTLWLGLAAQSRGRERAQAVARLRVLSPAVAEAFSPGASP